MFAGDDGFYDDEPPGEGGGGGAVGGAGGRGRAPPGGGQPHPPRLQVGLTRKKISLLARRQFTKCNENFRKMRKFSFAKK